MYVLAIAALLCGLVLFKSEGFKAKKPKKPKKPFPTLSNAWGTYHFYDEKGNGDGSPYTATACADVKNKHLKKYPWVAINPPTFNLSNDGTVFRKTACGKCIEVQRKAGKNRQKQKFVVVDIKGDKGIDMSHHGFKKLGMSDNEFVKVKQVPC